MSKEARDILFSEIFNKPVKFTSDVKKVRNGIRGNIRLAKGMFRTDEEKEKYLNESLERQLP